MRTKTIRNLSVALLAASFLFAQGPQILKFQVPFGFQMGDKALPAGQYTVDTNPSQGLVTVRSEDGKAGAMRLSIAIGRPPTPNESKLIFNRYG